MRVMRSTTSSIVPYYYILFLIIGCCYYLDEHQHQQQNGSSRNNNNGIVAVVESFVIVKQNQQQQNQQQSNRVNYNKNSATTSTGSTTTTTNTNKKRVLFGVSTSSSSKSSSTTILKLSLGNNNYLSQLSFLDDNDNNNNNNNNNSNETTTTLTSSTTSTSTSIENNSNNDNNNENIISWTARAEARMMMSTSSTTSSSISTRHHPSLQVTPPPSSRIISAIQTSSQEQQFDNNDSSISWKSATGTTGSSTGNSLSSTTQQQQQQQQQQFPIMSSLTDSSTVQSQFTPFTEQQQLKTVEDRSVLVGGIDNTQTSDIVTGTSDSTGSTSTSTSTSTGLTSTNTNTSPQQQSQPPTKELLQVTIDEIVYNERQRQIKLQQHLDMLLQQNKEQKLQQDLYVQTKQQQQYQPTTSTSMTKKNDDGGVAQYQSQFNSYYNVDSYNKKQKNTYNDLYNTTITAQTSAASTSTSTTATSTIISPNQYLYSDDNNNNNQVNQYQSNTNNYNNYNYNTNNNNYYDIVPASSTDSIDKTDAVSRNSNSHITTGSTTDNNDNDDATKRLWKYLQSITSVESSKTNTISLSSLSSSSVGTAPVVPTTILSLSSNESDLNLNNYPTGTNTETKTLDDTNVANSEQPNDNTNQDGSMVDYDKFINDIITQARTIVAGGQSNNNNNNNNLLNVTKATTTVGSTTTTTISISLPPSSKTNNNNNNNNNTITTFTISHNNNNNVINDSHDINDVTNNAVTTGTTSTDATLLSKPIDSNTPIIGMDNIVDGTELLENQDSNSNTNNYNMEKIYHENDINTGSYKNDYFTSEDSIGTSNTDAADTKNVNYNDDTLQSSDTTGSTSSSGSSTYTSNNDDEDFDLSKYRQALEDSQRLLKMFNKYEQKEPKVSSTSSSQQQQQRLNNTSSHQGRTTTTTNTVTGGDGGSSAGMTMSSSSSRKSGKPTSPPLSQPIQQVIPRRKSVFVADLINKNEHDQQQQQQQQKYDTTLNDKRSNSTNDVGTTGSGNYDAVIEDSIKLLSMLKEFRQEMGLTDSETSITSSEGPGTSTGTYGNEKEYKDFMNLPTIDDLHDKDLIISSSRPTKKDTINDSIKKIKVSTSSTNDQRKQQQQQQQPPLSRVFEPKMDEVHARRSFGISDNISTGDRDSNDKRWSNPISTRVNSVAASSEPIKNDSNKKDDVDDKIISSTNSETAVPAASSTTIPLDHLQDTEQSIRKDNTQSNNDNDKDDITGSDSVSAPRQTTAVASPTPAAPPIFSQSSSYSSDRVPTVLQSNPFLEEMSKHITRNKGSRSTHTPDTVLQQQEEQQLVDNQNEISNEMPPDRISVPSNDSSENRMMTQPKGARNDIHNDPLPNREDDTFATNEKEAPAQMPAPSPAAPIFSQSSSYSNDRVPTVLQSNPFLEEMSKHITGNKGSRSSTQSPDVAKPQQEQQQLADNQKEISNEMPPGRISVPKPDVREDRRMTQSQGTRNDIPNDPMLSKDDDDVFTRIDSVAPTQQVPAPTPAATTQQVPAPTPAAPIFSQSSSYSSDRVPTVLMSNPFEEEMSKHITGNRGNRSTQNPDTASEQLPVVDNQNEIGYETTPDRITVPAHDVREDRSMTQSEGVRNDIQNDPLLSRGDDSFTRIDSVAPVQTPAPTPAAPIFSQSSSYSSDRVPTVLMSNPFEEEMSKHITGNRGSRSTQNPDAASLQPEQQQLAGNQNEIRNETPPDRVSAPKTDVREGSSVTQPEGTRNDIQNDPSLNGEDAFTRIDSVAPVQTPAPTPAAPIFSQSSSYSSDRVPTVLMSNPFEEEMSKHITGNRGSRSTPTPPLSQQIIASPPQVERNAVDSNRTSTLNERILAVTKDSDNISPSKKENQTIEASKKSNEMQAGYDDLVDSWLNPAPAVNSALQVDGKQSVEAGSREENYNDILGNDTGLDSVSSSPSSSLPSITEADSPKVRFVSGDRKASTESNPIKISSENNLPSPSITMTPVMDSALTSINDRVPTLLLSNPFQEEMSKHIGSTKGRDTISKTNQTPSNHLQRCKPDSTNIVNNIPKQNSDNTIRHPITRENTGRRESSSTSNQVDADRLGSNWAGQTKAIPSDEAVKNSDKDLVIQDRFTNVGNTNEMNVAKEVTDYSSSVISSPIEDDNAPRPTPPDFTEDWKTSWTSPPVSSGQVTRIDPYDGKAPTPAAPVTSASLFTSNGRVPTSIMSNPFQEEMSKHIGSKTGRKNQVEAATAASPLPSATTSSEPIDIQRLTTASIRVTNDPYLKTTQKTELERRSIDSSSNGNSMSKQSDTVENDIQFQIDIDRMTGSQTQPSTLDGDRIVQTSTTGVPNGKDLNSNTGKKHRELSEISTSGNGIGTASHERVTTKATTVPALGDSISQNGVVPTIPRFGNLLGANATSTQSRHSPRSEVQPFLDKASKSKLTAESMEETDSNNNLKSFIAPENEIKGSKMNHGVTPEYASSTFKHNYFDIASAMKRHNRPQNEDTFAVDNKVDHESTAEEVKATTTSMSERKIVATDTTTLKKEVNRLSQQKIQALEPRVPTVTANGRPSYGNIDNETLSNTPEVQEDCIPIQKELGNELSDSRADLSIRRNSKQSISQNRNDIGGINTKKSNKSSSGFDQINTSTNQFNTTKSPGASTAFVTRKSFSKDLSSGGKAVYKTKPTSASQQLDETPLQLMDTLNASNDFGKVKRVVSHRNTTHKKADLNENTQTDLKMSKLLDQHTSSDLHHSHNASFDRGTNSTSKSNQHVVLSEGILHDEISEVFCLDQTDGMNMIGNDINHTTISLLNHEDHQVLKNATIFNTTATLTTMQTLSKVTNKVTSSEIIPIQQLKETAVRAKQYRSVDVSNTTIGTGQDSLSSDGNSTIVHSMKCNSSIHGRVIPTKQNQLNDIKISNDKLASNRTKNNRIINASQDVSPELPCYNSLNEKVDKERIKQSKQKSLATATITPGNTENSHMLGVRIGENGISFKTGRNNSVVTNSSSLNKGRSTMRNHYISSPCEASELSSEIEAIIWNQSVTLNTTYIPEDEIYMANYSNTSNNDTVLKSSFDGLKSWINSTFLKLAKVE